MSEWIILMIRKETLRPEWRLAKAPSDWNKQQVVDAASQKATGLGFTVCGAAWSDEDIEPSPLSWILGLKND